MKSVLSVEKTIEPKPFPKLLVHDKGYVVLFTNSSIGTVVHSECNVDLGSIIKPASLREFRDFNGSVTLYND